MVDNEKVDVKPKISNGAIPKITASRPTLSTTSRDRLPSFKAPRDLTLGLPKTGAGPALANCKPRKTFAPTIPVRRDRSKEKDDDHRSGHQFGRQRDDRRGGRGKGERGRGRGKDRNNLIQTMGNVFGEGLGDLGKRRPNASYGGAREGGGREEANFIPVPKLNLQHDKKVDHEEESAKLRELLRDDFIDDPFPDPEPNFTPVQLPMLESVKKEKMWEDETESAENIAAFIKKEEGAEEEEDDKNNKKAIKKVKMKKSASQKAKPILEPSMTELFKREEGELLLMQLPDCLPGLGPEKEKSRPGSSKPSHDPSTSATADSKEPELSPYCTLNTLPEGCLGKLQVLKSGRTRLVMGQHSLHVDMGTQVGFLQEAVSVSLDDQTKSGNMIVLGNVNRRLVITPDWDIMLSQMSMR